MITFFILAVFQINALYAVPPTGVQPQSWMKDQNDQTDTFAIPLDSSEEEEKQEEEQLLKKQAEKNLMN